MLNNRVVITLLEMMLEIALPTLLTYSQLSIVKQSCCYNFARNCAAVAFCTLVKFWLYRESRKHTRRERNTETW